MRKTRGGWGETGRYVSKNLRAKNNHVILRSFSILQITSFKSVTSVPQSYILCPLIELLNRTCVGSGLSCDSKIIFYNKQITSFKSVTSVPQSYILCPLIELLNRTCVGSGLSCDSKIIFYNKQITSFKSVTSVPQSYILCRAFL